jgi:hypothetical protein
MSELFNWVTALAYFAVFLIGLAACFKNAHAALLCRQFSFIPSWNKRGYTLKIIAHSTIAVLGILGLIQAFAGV